MLIIGTDDLEGLEKMADMAGEARGAEYPLVGVPMVWRTASGSTGCRRPVRRPRARTAPNNSKVSLGADRRSSAEASRENHWQGAGIRCENITGAGSVRVSGWCGNRHRPGRATLVYSMIGKQRGAKMDAARAELRDVLLDARSLISLPGNNFDWSWWQDAEAALRQIDRLVALLERGWVPSRPTMAVLFAPTGPIQEVSLSSGWAEEFLALAERFDAAAEAFYFREPWWRRLLS